MKEKKDQVGRRGWDKNERWRRNRSKTERKFGRDEERWRKKERERWIQRKGAKSHWFTVVDLRRFFSSLGIREEPRKQDGEKGRQCCDARSKLGRNFDGRSEKTMKLDRRTSLEKWKKIRSRSSARSPFELSELCELIFGVYARAILLSFRSTR